MPTEPSELLRPEQAARLLGVSTRTLIRWESEGRLVSIRTAGGHRRYREIDLYAVNIKRAL